MAGASSVRCGGLGGVSPTTSLMGVGFARRPWSSRSSLSFMVLKMARPAWGRQSLPCMPKYETLDLCPDLWSSYLVQEATTSPSKDERMTGGTLKTGEAKREYGQLLHLHARLLRQLQQIRDDLAAPGTGAIIRAIRRRTGTSPDEGLSDVAGAVEEAIRALKLSESKVREEIMADQRTGGGPNHGRKSSKFIQDCTICCTCRPTLPDAAVLKGRGNGIKWRMWTPPGGTSPDSEPSRWQSGQVLSYVRPLDAAIVGRGPVWCS